MTTDCSTTGMVIIPLVVAGSDSTDLVTLLRRCRARRLETGLFDLPLCAGSLSLMVSASKRW